MEAIKPPVVTFVSNIFDGVTTAYIYIWMSKNWKILYIGQTNDFRGTLGRACGHVSETGSLRARFESEVGLSLERADDLVLLSFPLPRRPEYVGAESSYREAVEYLVQVRLYEARARLRPIPKLLSTIRCSTARISDPAVQKYADQVVKALEIHYAKAS